MKMERKCRIWWPKQLSSCEPAPTVLFGWFVNSSPASLDIIVAIAASPDEISFSSSQSGALQGVLHSTNAKMPLFLQDKSTFSILGYCAANCSFNGQLKSAELEEDDITKLTNYDKEYLQNNQDLCGKNNWQWHCECQKLDRFFEECRQYNFSRSNWIQLSFDSHDYYPKKICWIPKLHHIHWSGGLVSSCDLHVIIYDPPKFGTHHFSLSSWGSPEQEKTALKRPKWIDKLNEKQPLSDLDTVVLAINSATAAKVLFERCMGCKISFNRLVSITWHLVAISVASFFTVFYIVLQFCHGLLSCGSCSLIYKILAKVFSHTWKNVHIRSCQLLYWPTFLLDGGFRSQASVEYVERAALRRHSLWSSIAVDILLGNVAGLALLIHTEAACLWVSNLIHDITNNLLRSGCVWLMGVPAGFKLNMELAGILGMISLNAIQIWSTLWFFVSFLFRYFIRGLAISGIILGATVPAALVMDMILLATLHLSTLHWLISHLYSKQIQALAALWRLFRGRKWNPLRQRLDSYDYTVEQHIVGSLLFTPLLLLLPTTSVFYIFFTIMNTSTNAICILIEVTISILHATPYAKFFLWMVRPRRFPSGMWFEILSAQSSRALGSPEAGNFSEVCSTSGKSHQRKTEHKDSGRSTTMISLLHSNFLDIRQIILPCYRNVFGEVSVSSVASSAYGLLIGRRISSALGTGLPSTMPWMSVTYREYWWLSHDSVISCMGNHYSDGVS